MAPRTKEAKPEETGHLQRETSVATLPVAVSPKIAMDVFLPPPEAAALRGALPSALKPSAPTPFEQQLRELTARFKLTIEASSGHSQAQEKARTKEEEARLKGVIREMTQPTQPIIEILDDDFMAQHPDLTDLIRPPKHSGINKISDDKLAEMVQAEVKQRPPGFNFRLAMLDKECSRRDFCTNAVALSAASIVSWWTAMRIIEARMSMMPDEVRQVIYGFAGKLVDQITRVTTNFQAESLQQETLPERFRLDEYGLWVMSTTPIQDLTPLFASPKPLDQGQFAKSTAEIAQSLGLSSLTPLMSKMYPVEAWQASPEQTARLNSKLDPKHVEMLIPHVHLDSLAQIHNLPGEKVITAQSSKIRQEHTKTFNTALQALKTIYDQDTSLEATNGLESVASVQLSQDTFKKCLTSTHQHTYNEIRYLHNLIVLDISTAGNQAEAQEKRKQLTRALSFLPPEMIAEIARLELTSHAVPAVSLVEFLAGLPDPVRLQSEFLTLYRLTQEVTDFRLEGEEKKDAFHKLNSFLENISGADGAKIISALPLRMQKEILENSPAERLVAWFFALGGHEPSQAANSLGLRQFDPTEVFDVESFASTLTRVNPEVFFKFMVQMDRLKTPAQSTWRYLFSLMDKKNLKIDDRVNSLKRYILNAALSELENRGSNPTSASPFFKLIFTELANSGGYNLKPDFFNLLNNILKRIDKAPLSKLMGELSPVELGEALFKTHSTGNRDISTWVWKLINPVNPTERRDLIRSILSFFSGEPAPNRVVFDAYCHFLRRLLDNTDANRNRDAYQYFETIFREGSPILAAAILEDGLDHKLTEKMLSQLPDTDKIFRDKTGVDLAALQAIAGEFSIPLGKINEVLQQIPDVTTQTDTELANTLAARTALPPEIILAVVDSLPLVVISPRRLMTAVLAYLSLRSSLVPEAEMMAEMMGNLAESVKTGFFQNLVINLDSARVKRDLIKICGADKQRAVMDHLMHEIMPLAAHGHLTLDRMTGEMKVIGIINDEENETPADHTLGALASNLLEKIKSGHADITTVKELSAQVVSIDAKGLIVKFHLPDHIRLENPPGDFLRDSADFMTGGNWHKILVEIQNKIKAGEHRFRLAIDNPSDILSSVNLLADINVDENGVQRVIPPSLEALLQIKSVADMRSVHPILSWFNREFITLTGPFEGLDQKGEKIQIDPMRHSLAFVRRDLAEEDGINWVILDLMYLPGTREFATDLHKRERIRVRADELRRHIDTDRIPISLGDIMLTIAISAAVETGAASWFVKEVLSKAPEAFVHGSIATLEIGAAATQGGIRVLRIADKRLTPVAIKATKKMIKIPIDTIKAAQKAVKAISGKIQTVDWTGIIQGISSQKDELLQISGAAIKTPGALTSEEMTHMGIEFLRQFLNFKPPIIPMGRNTIPIQFTRRELFNPVKIKTAVDELAA